MMIFLLSNLHKRAQVTEGSPGPELMLLIAKRKQAEQAIKHIHTWPLQRESSYLSVPVLNSCLEFLWWWTMSYKVKKSSSPQVAFGHTVYYHNGNSVFVCYCSRVIVLLWQTLWTKKELKVKRIYSIFLIIVGHWAMPRHGFKQVLECRPAMLLLTKEHHWKLRRY